jgi:hypothetical protein
MYEMVAAACNIPMDQTIDFSCYYYLFGAWKSGCLAICISLPASSEHARF